MAEGSAAVLEVKPGGTPLVTIGTITVPGSTLLLWLVIVCAVSNNVLNAKLVPVKVAVGCRPEVMPPVSRPVVITLAGLVSIR